MNDKVEELRREAERALGWDEGASNYFSLPTLREFIREKHPELYEDLGDVIKQGEHLFTKIPKRRM